MNVGREVIRFVVCVSMGTGILACRGVMPELSAPQLDSDHAFKATTTSAVSAVRAVMSETDAVESKYSQSQTQHEIEGKTSDGKRLLVVIRPLTASAVDISVTVNYGIGWNERADFYDKLSQRLLKAEVSDD